MSEDIKLGDLIAISKQVGRTTMLRARAVLLVEHDASGSLIEI